MTRKLKATEHSYTVSQSNLGFSGGRYMSAEPMNAARKAGRRILRDPAHSSNRIVYLQLTRTTQGDSGAEFHYKVEKKKIPTKDQKPMRFKREGGGKTVDFTATDTFVVTPISPGVYAREK